MKIKLLLLGSTLLFCPLIVSSQSIRDNIPSVISEAKKQGTNQSTRLVLTKIPAAQKEEYVLYRDIIRKYTWYEGVGDPINQETANHLPYYFKMTMKNKCGHWQHIEAMYQGKMTTSHNKTTYVLDKRNDNDDSTNEWVDKLKTVSQWFLTSDLSEENVVEERAYTPSGDLVYSFMPVRNENGRITGCYNDAWGLPADMREDSTATYGSVVCITYDSCGRDSIIDFLDGQGLRKYNSNGVDQQRYQYDSKDRVTLVTSHNMVGDYTIDNWGNCGNRYEYDERNSTYSIIRVDKELKPMRMPSLRADSTRTFIRCDIRKDKWGRDVEATMLTETGKPDQTTSGIHKIVYNYDSKGKLLSTIYLDKNNSQLNY